MRYTANGVFAGDTWTRPKDGARFRVLKAHLRRDGYETNVRVLLRGLDGPLRGQEFWLSWPIDHEVDIEKPPHLFRT